MPRLSIDITPEEHAKLKAIAALKGQSIKDYVLTRTLGDAPDTASMTEAEALQALRDLLEQRLDSASAGNISKLNVLQIAEAARKEYSS